MFRRINQAHLLAGLNLVVILLLLFSTAANLISAIEREDWVMIAVETVLVPAVLAALGSTVFVWGRTYERRRIYRVPPRIHRVGPNRLRIEYGPITNPLTIEMTISPSGGAEGSAVTPTAPTQEVHSWLEEHRN